MENGTKIRKFEPVDGLVCPECGALRKVDGSYGWWIYSTGKWACDCGADGTAWYSGEEVSTLG